MRSPHAAAIEALAAPYEGVITQQLLVAAGVRPELASRQVAARRWRRMLPGVYLTSRAAVTLTRRCYAALLYAGPDALVSGNAGCRLRRLSGADEGDASVTVLLPSRVRRASSGFCRVVRVGALPPGQRLVRDGRAALPVAEAERCVADAIRGAKDLGSARARATAALRDGSLNWDAVAREARRRGPGAGHLGRVIRDVADGVRSPAEGDVNDVVARAAARGTLPPYLLNPDVLVDGVLLGSPDLWVVGLGLGNEVDSREHHEETEALDRTLLRHERFSHHGLVLNHVTPRRFHSDPRAFVAQLGALVQQRRQLAEPEPPGLVVLGRGPLLPAREPWPQVASYRWC